ncbi:hypothetical protein [Allorhodopirellula solitaria]|uniref:hypothetical protein n=1 Tax=Allorhodopirellula solitaria TaxID=2527987 RepID=UPI0011B546B5|nr:hypothetical protein [Allorhodopirellula solitaria]
MLSKLPILCIDATPTPPPIGAAAGWSNSDSTRDYRSRECRSIQLQGSLASSSSPWRDYGVPGDSRASSILADRQWC